MRLVVWLALALLVCVPSRSSLAQNPCVGPLGRIISLFLGRRAPAQLTNDVPDTPRKRKRIPDKEIRKTLKAFSKVQEEARNRYHFENESKSPALKQLPEGLPEKYLPAFQRIYQLFSDHDLLFRRAQQLEYEIYYRSLKDKIPFEDAYHVVLAEREAKHGFLPVTTLPDRTLSAAEFMEMLRKGALFIDTTFHDKGRVGVGGAAHGSTTHRVLQWHAIMRDMEENPTLYNGVDAAELFKATGDPEITFRLNFRNSGVPWASGSDNGLWRYLFDEPLERGAEGGGFFGMPSRFSPEGMRGIHARLPLLGPLLH